MQEILEFFSFERIHALMQAAADWFWSGPVLFWLVGGGVVLSLFTGFVQFRRFGYIIRRVVSSHKERASAGGVSSHQALLAALSSTIGTGNIIGVAIGIAHGGPGAVFWMWVVGYVAMIIKYAEAFASVKFRRKRDDGSYDAGPFMYIQGAFKFSKWGKFFAILYAISMLTILNAAGVHTGALVDSLEQVSIPREASAIAVMALVFVVIFGGIKFLVRITDRLVPVMTLIFAAAAMVILCMNITAIPSTIALILRSAFEPVSAVGGFAGASVAAAIRWGCARGMYSSDAGNGITSIVHGQAEVKHPAEQAIYGVFEVFFDTIIVCSITAFVILSTGVWATQMPLNPATLTMEAFSSQLGAAGKYILLATVVLFALSTLLSFVYFVYEQAKSLTHSNAFAHAMQLVFLAAMWLGGVHGVNKMMIFSDVGNALQIIINMSILIILAPLIGRETKEYFKDK